jgi:RND family efflux transporter MFP subunit
MKIVESVVVSLALVGLVAAASTGCGRQKGEAKLPPARGQGAAPLPALPSVTSRDEGKVVVPTNERTTGTTVARAESQIGPNAGGVLARIFVKEGEKVRRGTVLFRQVTRDAELRVEQAEAALESARVSLKATETELARTKGLFDQKAVSQMEWDQVQARADAARAGAQQAQVALSIAQKMLADCTVRSPIDGVVTSKLKSEGEMATMMPPTVVLVVQDQSVLELRFKLPEGALGLVKAGQTIDANFAALGIKRPAKVVRIQPAADPQTRTIEVVSEITNRDGSLKSGLLAEVDLGKTARDAAARAGVGGAAGAADRTAAPQPGRGPAATTAAADSAPSANQREGQPR